MFGRNVDPGIVSASCIYQDRRNTEPLGHALLCGLKRLRIESVGNEKCRDSTVTLNRSGPALPTILIGPSTATFAPAKARPSAIAPPSTPVPPITVAISPVRSNKFTDPALA